MKANLSVIITNYNKPHQQLIECLNSILNQTVLPQEIIFIDDGSTDPRALASSVSIILPKNIGVAKARDMGVRMSKSKLILFVDGDDKLAPDFIQQCGRKITKAEIVYPTSLLFGENMESPKLSIPPTRVTAKYITGSKCSIPVTSMMWKKVYEDLGGFRELEVFEDWDFWIRAFAKGYKFAHANTLLYYRQNDQSRNHKKMSIKQEVHQDMINPYKIVNGQLVERNNGEQTS